eukprot:TRINITY_DN3580_c0_g2_i1.p1 TRINITY_DN3580_c0_g2~~TRINITY_DN3580_c0_g2_i1.p1  ORF type:complete len:922 (+),score=25.00 TRINITY_DN3580_c0_g2_i1:89-2854(+)
MLADSSLERCLLVLLACVVVGCNGITVCNVAPGNTATRDPSTLSTETSQGTGSELSFCTSLCFLKWTGMCSAGGYVRAGCLGFYTNANHGDTRYVRCAEQSQSNNCHAEVRPRGPTSGSCPTDVDLSPDGPLCSSVPYPTGMVDVDSSHEKASLEEYADHGTVVCPIRAPCWRGKHTVCLRENTCGCVDRWNHCEYEGSWKCPRGSYNPDGREPSEYNDEDRWWVEHCSATCGLCSSDEIVFPRLAEAGCDGNPASMANTTAPTNENDMSAVRAETRVLLMGSSESYDSFQEPPFVITDISTHLQNFGIDVVIEDVYQFRSPSELFSLAQYMFWPEGQSARDELLEGGGSTFDYVILFHDPYILSRMPGYFAEGVNMISNQIKAGGATPLLFMQWPGPGSSISVDAFSEITYRVGAGAQVHVIPAAKAWNGLEAKDASSTHPTPLGALVAAMAIYSEIFNASARGEFSNEGDVAALADDVFATVQRERCASHFSGPFSIRTPFSMSCTPKMSGEITACHTGTSTENGILRGIQGAVNLIWESWLNFQECGSALTDFNFGRGNWNYEYYKQYQVGPLYNMSFAFPMQEPGNFEDGLDKRPDGCCNDLQICNMLIERHQVPKGARCVPIRLMFNKMKAACPEECQNEQINSGYRDRTHMSRYLDSASGSYIYTIVSGRPCNFSSEPADRSSDDWRHWLGRQIGCETAWRLATLSAWNDAFGNMHPPCAGLLSDGRLSCSSQNDCPSGWLCSSTQFCMSQWYEDLGEGRCVVNGTDPTHDYLPGRAGSCDTLCTESPTCTGFSRTITTGNCILWTQSGLTGGGEPWGVAHCEVKRQAPTTTTTSQEGSPLWVRCSPLECHFPIPIPIPIHKWREHRHVMIQPQMHQPRRHQRQVLQPHLHRRRRNRQEIIRPLLMTVSSEEFTR